jgi:hypothetical protein
MTTKLPIKLSNKSFFDGAALDRRFASITDEQKKGLAQMKAAQKTRRDRTPVVRSRPVTR